MRVPSRRLSSYLLVTIWYAACTSGRVPRPEDPLLHEPRSTFSTSVTAHVRSTPLEWFRATFSRDRVLEALPLLVLGFFLLWKLLYGAMASGEMVDEGWYPFTARRGLQGLVANLGPLLLFMAPLWLLRRGQRFWGMWVLNLLLTLVVLANVVHLRFFGDVVAVSAVRNAHQLPAVSDSVIDLLRATDLLLFLDLAIAALLFPWYRRSLRGIPVVGPKGRRRAAAGSAVAGLVILLAVPLPLALIDRGDILRREHLRFGGARKIGLVNYHLYDAGRFFYREWVRRREITPRERERVMRYVQERRAGSAANSPLFGAARGSNVVVVMLESLQAFTLDLRVDGQPVTPHLSALAGRSMRFENFYDQTWEGKTSDAEFLTLQSLHPLPTGALATTYPTNDYRGLPHVLRAHGYSTVSAHAFYGAFWNRRITHPRLGFQRSFFRAHFRGDEKIGMGLGDPAFLTQSAAILAEQPEPFLALLITLSTHHPYELPDRYKKLELGKLEGTLLGDYLHTVHYLDGAVGEFIEQLRQADLLENTVLVLFGDHKTELGPRADLERLLAEHAGWRPREAFDARFWREEHRIPLLIRLPEGAAAGSYEVAGGQIDLAPTILALLGIDPAEMVALGSDLTRTSGNLVVFRDGSFLQGDTVCLNVGAFRCHDVRSGAELPAENYATRAEQAARRLEISDLMLRGDLIPAAARLPAPRASTEPAIPQPVAGEPEPSQSFRRGSVRSDSPRRVSGISPASTLRMISGSSW